MIGLSHSHAASQPLQAPHRLELIEELYQRYGNTYNSVHRLRYLRKKYSWLMVVGATRGLKRALDIVVSSNRAN